MVADHKRRFPRISDIRDNPRPSSAIIRVLMALACFALLPQPAFAADRSIFSEQSPEQIAGYIFGVSVPVGNYYFAKRVSYMFPHPQEERAGAAEREQFIWEALILHYEAFRQGMTVSDAQLEERINNVLSNQKQSFTRGGDPKAYADWVKKTVGEDVELFENQMRYLLTIDLFKDRRRESFPVTVTEEEMRQEFLNEKNHVGGEMAVFDAKEEAQAFYERVRDPSRWEDAKASGEPPIKPVAMMTLEAYMDLWTIPKEQIYAFHAMEIGSVGPPMPFGTKQWCVYRLLDKRTGDLKDFPKERGAYDRQLKSRKQYDTLKRWIEDLKANAKLKVVPLTPTPGG